MRYSGSGRPGRDGGWDHRAYGRYQAAAESARQRQHEYESLSEMGRSSAQEMPEMFAVKSFAKTATTLYDGPPDKNCLCIARLTYESQ